MTPICPFTATSSLIKKKSQFTLDLVAKDVEKVVFQKMRKSFKSGQVRCLIFTFNVSSKIRVYENLKNVFQEAMGKQSFSNQTRYQASDIAGNQAKITLDLSLKNVKNAFFESMISHQNANGITSLTFTFTTLSVEPIYEEIDSQTRKDSEESNSPSISLETYPTGVIFNPLYNLVKEPIYEEVAFQKENKDSKKNNPPPIPSLETLPTRRVFFNPLYELVTERKNPGKIRKFFNKCFARKSLPVPIQHAFDSGFTCNAETKDFKGPLNISHNEEPIYKNIKERKDSGYETSTSSPRESIKSIFSDSDYEVPRQVEPAIYLEVLP
ncbi:MAG TPA: hypothetical protein VGZ69_01020 [Candidatus Rhabdochlamydia sp.]|jgi:hypothetical protein|nr:hypothetical protein [Candidatus Rhabdochlamydia sp.]